MNKVTLIGYLGDAPLFGETTKTKTPYARISLATNQVYKDRNGDKQDRTDWHRVTAFAGLARSLKMLCKGDLVAVHGHLRTDVVEKDGEKRSYVGVIATEVKFLKLKNKPRPEDEPIEEGLATEAEGDGVEGDDIPF